MPRDPNEAFDAYAATLRDPNEAFDAYAATLRDPNEAFDAYAATLTPARAASQQLSQPDYRQATRPFDPEDRFARRYQPAEETPEQSRYQQAGLDYETFGPRAVDLRLGAAPLQQRPRGRIINVQGMQFEEVDGELVELTPERRRFLEQRPDLLQQPVSEVPVPESMRHLPRSATGGKKAADREGLSSLQQGYQGRSAEHLAGYEGAEMFSRAAQRALTPFAQALMTPEQGRSDIPNPFDAQDLRELVAPEGQGQYQTYREFAGLEQRAPYAQGGTLPPPATPHERLQREALVTLAEMFTPDVDMITEVATAGAPSLLKRLGRTASRMSRGRALTRLQPSVPRGQIREMADAAAAGAPVQIASPQVQARLERQADLTADTETPSRPLAQLAETERQLGQPRARPAGPKSAYELRRELRRSRATDDPNAAFDEFAKSLKTDEPGLVSPPRAPEDPNDAFDRYAEGLSRSQSDESTPIVQEVLEGADQVEPQVLEVDLDQVQQPPTASPEQTRAWARTLSRWDQLQQPHLVAARQSGQDVNAVREWFRSIEPPEVVEARTRLEQHLVDQNAPPVTRAADHQQSVDGQSAQVDQAPLMPRAALARPDLDQVVPAPPVARAPELPVRATPPPRVADQWQTLRAPDYVRPEGGGRRIKLTQQDKVWWPTWTPEQRRNVLGSRGRARVGMDFEPDAAGVRLAPDEPSTGGTAPRVSRADDIAAAQQRLDEAREYLTQKKASAAEAASSGRFREQAARELAQAEEDLEVAKNQFNRLVIQDETGSSHISASARVGMDFEPAPTNVPAYQRLREQMTRPRAEPEFPRTTIDQETGAVVREKGPNRSDPPGTLIDQGTGQIHVPREDLETYSSYYQGEGMSLEQVQKRLDSLEHRMALREYALIDEAEGLSTRQISGSGVYRGAGEPMIITELVKDAPDGNVMRAVAHKGASRRQLAMAIWHTGEPRPGFRVEPGGKGHYYEARKLTLKVEGGISANELGSVLKHSKVEYATIIRHPDHWELRFLLEETDLDAFSRIRDARNRLPVLSWAQEKGRVRLVVSDEYDGLVGAEAGGVRPPGGGDFQGRSERVPPGQDGDLPPPETPLGRWAQSQLDRREQPESPRVGQDAGPSGPAPSYTVDGQRVELAGIQTHPLHPSSLVRLAKELSGKVEVSEALQELGRRMGGRVRGRVKGRDIELEPGVWLDPKEAARVLGHEIGHLPDWVPNMDSETMGGRVSQLRSKMRAHFRAMSQPMRAELLELSKWWRPFDEQQATKAYLRYREDPEELFADAMSLLLNNPAELRQRAPLFWAQMHQFLSGNKDMQQRLARVYDEMSGTMDDLAEGLHHRITAAWADGDAFLQELANAAELRKMSLWERLRQQWQAKKHQAERDFSDRGAYLKRRAEELRKQGKEIPTDLDPTVTFDQFNLAGNKLWVASRDWKDNVMDVLEQADLAGFDLGSYMLNQAATSGSLRGVALPEGLTADLAELTLARLTRGMSAEQVQAVERAARGARDVFYHALRDGVEAGTISRDMADQLEATRDFVPLAAREMRGRIPEEIRLQTRGTLDSIRDPAVALLHDALELHNLNTSNHAKLRATRFAELAGDPVVELAEGAKPPRGLEPLDVYQNGQVKRYAVDPYLAEVFQRVELGPIKLWTDFLTQEDNLFRWLWIAASPAFHAKSFIRDLQRYARNMSALGHLRWYDPTNIVRALGDYASVVRPALAYAFDASDLARFGFSPQQIEEAKALVRQAIDEFALVPPEDSIAAQIAGNLTSGREQLARYFDPNAAEKNRGLMSTLARRITQAGQTLESTAKLAAYRRIARQGRVSVAERAAHIRDYVGMPNTTISGRLTPISNRLFMFSNVALQGWKADLRILGKPSSALGAWTQMFYTALWPTVAMGAGLAGVFGRDVQKSLEAIPERDREGSFVVPLAVLIGGEHGQATGYLSIPLDPTAKFFRVATSRVLNQLAGVDPRPMESTIGALFKSVVDEIPSGSPSLALGANWLSIMAGENPTDSFGRPVLTSSEQDAGWQARTKGALRYTAGQLGPVGKGLSKLLGPYKPGRNDDGLLAWAASMPGLMDYIKISDYGYSEQQRLRRELDTQARARRKESYGAKTRYLYDEMNRLKRLGGQRTAQQTRQVQFLEAFEGQLKAVDEQVARLEAAGKHRQAQSLRQRFERSQAEGMATAYNRLSRRR